MRPPSPFSALPPPDLPEASPKAISRRTSYIRARALFSGRLVRSSMKLYLHFNLPMDRSPGFGSASCYFIALFRLALASAPSLKLLTSQHNATRRSVLQKVRCRTLIVLHLLVNTGFPGFFSPFPHGTMRYRSLIVFRLGGWSPLLPTGFLVSRGTLVQATYLHLPLRACHPLRSSFPEASGQLLSDVACPQPRASVDPRFGLLIEFSFFSSGYLDVSLPRVPSSRTMDSFVGDRALPRPGSPIRIPADQCLLAAPRSFSQLIASFFGNQCPGIHPALLFA